MDLNRKLTKLFNVRYETTDKKPQIEFLATRRELPGAYSPQGDYEIDNHGNVRVTVCLYDRTRSKPVVHQVKVRGKRSKPRELCQSILKAISDGAKKLGPGP